MAGRLETAHLPEAPRWRLALPGGNAARGLVVVLHGRGGNADSAFDDVGLGEHVHRTGLAVVSVDGGNGYWHARRDGTDAGAMVTDDLVPLALQHAGLGPDAPVATFGWSMGGFGALHLAATHGPKRIAAAVAVSAALWRKAGETPEGAFDDREDYERNSIFNRTAQLARTPVLLECGTSDPFIAANRALVPRLARSEHRFDEGGHDNEYWRSHAGGQFDWLAAQLR